MAPGLLGWLSFGYSLTDFPYSSSFSSLAAALAASTLGEEEGEMAMAVTLRTLISCSGAIQRCQEKKQGALHAAALERESVTVTASSGA